MLPEVITYVRKIDEAYAELRATQRKLYALSPTRGAAIGQPQDYGDKINEAWRVHDKIVKDAWVELRESHDPLVRWISQHCGEFREEGALEILKQLPAPLEELDNRARLNGWDECPTWQDFRREAISDGVVPRPPDDAQDTLVRYVRDALDADHGELQRFRVLLNDVVEEARKS